MKKKNRFRIPETFELFGFTIKVKWDDTLIENENIYGVAYNQTGEIVLQTPFDEYSKIQVEETFLHEVLHLILDYSGYRKESSNEKFVECVANLLHQMFVTAKYSKLNDKMIDYFQ